MTLKINRKFSLQSLQYQRSSLFKASVYFYHILPFCTFRTITTYFLWYKRSIFRITNVIIQATISNKTVVTLLLRWCVDQWSKWTKCMSASSTLAKYEKTKNLNICYSSLFCVHNHTTHLHKNAHNGFLQSIPFNLCSGNSMFN